MIKLIILSVMLNTNEIVSILPDKIKIESKRRSKGQRGRRKGGFGLR
jgi:hypothetical protein